MSVILFLLSVFFFKQKTAYEMRISDWSSDVCSSDLLAPGREALCRLLEQQPRDDVGNRLRNIRTQFANAWGWLVSDRAKQQRQLRVVERRRSDQQLEHDGTERIQVAGRTER